MWTPARNSKWIFHQLQGSILQRQDIAFVLRKPETGVLLPLRGSSSCVTGDPAASDSAQSPPKHPESPSERFSGGGPSSSSATATQSAKGSLTGGTSRLSPVTTKYPAGGSGEDHVGRIAGHDEAALSRGNGVWGAARAAARPCRDGGWVGCSAPERHRQCGRLARLANRPLIGGPRSDGLRGAVAHQAAIRLARSAAHAELPIICIERRYLPHSTRRGAHAWKPTCGT